MTNLAMGLQLGSPVLRGGSWTPARLFANGEQGVWYDPSDSSTVFQDAAGTTPAGDGDPVGRIDDKSGNGNHATQNVSAARPTLRKTAGGLWYLEFDGVDDHMVSGLDAGIGDNDRAIFIAGTGEDEDADPYKHWIHGGTPQTDSTFGLVYVVNNLTELGNHYWNSGYSSGITTDTLDVYSVTKTGSLEVYKKAATGETNTRTGSILSTQAGSYIIFGRADPIIEFGKGTCYGIVIAHKTLTNGESSSLESYLAAKCGVTL